MATSHEIGQGHLHVLVSLYDPCPISGHALLYFLSCRATNKFTLKFNAINATPNPLELCCAVYQSPVDGSLTDAPTHTQSWNIDGSCNKRMAVELKKFVLPELEEASEEEVLEQYQHHLANLVRITWTSVSFV